MDEERRGGEGGRSSLGFDRNRSRSSFKSLRIGVHHANGVAWEAVFRPRERREGSIDGSRGDGGGGGAHRATSGRAVIALAAARWDAMLRAREERPVRVACGAD
jgi:hypothetical protein